MVFIKETEVFIEKTCKNLYKVEDYNMFVKRLTEMVESFGEKHGLDENEMDAIQNEIFLRLER